MKNNKIMRFIMAFLLVVLAILAGVNLYQYINTSSATSLLYMIECAGLIGIVVVSTPKRLRETE